MYQLTSGSQGRNFPQVVRQADVAESSPTSDAGRGGVIQAGKRSGASAGGEEAERVLRRSLGPTAWAVLADLCLDAEVDDGGATVVATSARHVAAHLGIGKDTAARALARLSAAGLLRRRPQGANAAGRFTCGAYELCLGCAVAMTPCRPSEDTVRCPPSESRASGDPPSVSLTAATGVVGSTSRRRPRATVRSQPGQLSLLESASGDAGNLESSR
jgi:hypothetical protein